MDALGVPFIAGTDAGLSGSVFDRYTLALAMYAWLGFATSASSNSPRSTPPTLWASPTPPAASPQAWTPIYSSSPAIPSPTSAPFTTSGSS